MNCDANAYELTIDGNKKFDDLIKSEYCESLKYTLSETTVLKGQGRLGTLSTAHLLKQFVSEVGDKHPSVVKFLGSTFASLCLKQLLKAWNLVWIMCTKRNTILMIQLTTWILQVC